MKHAISTLCLAAAVLSVAACESYPTSMPPGEYESNHTSTNQYGTKTEQNTKTDVYYDANGNKRAKQETETTTDPKGLFNKTTSKSTTTY